MNDELLKTCPFCGTTPGIELLDVGYWYIGCIYFDCDVMPNIKPHIKDKQEAIEAWNNRQSEG